MGNWGADHQLRSSADFRLGVAEKLREAGAKCVQSRGPGEGFIEAEHGEDDLRRMIAQVVAVILKVGAPRPQVDLIGGPAEVPHTQAFVGKTEVQIGFKITIVLHPLGQRVADDDQLGAVAQFQHGRWLRCGGVGLCGSRPDERGEENQQHG